MPQKRKIMRSTDQLTTKQKLFVEILVKNWGQISKFEALKKAGYNSKNDATARVLASKKLSTRKK